MDVRRVAVGHPIGTFLIICYGINWAVVVPPLRTAVDVLPMDLEGYESLGTLLGVAGAAFAVTAAVDGRAGVRDLALRSVRWRAGARWYFLALLAMPTAVLVGATAVYGWAPASAIADGGSALPTRALSLLVLSVLLFNLPEEIGWTGFLQARLQDHHGPLKACALVALPFALFHVPVNVVDGGWVFAVAFLPVQTVLFLFVRAVLIWFYNGTRNSVLFAGLFHSGFNATVNTFDDVTPGPAGSAVLIGTAAVSLSAVVIVVLTRGRLSYQP